MTNLEHGSILVAVLMVVSIMAIAVASYLSLVSSQNKTVARSIAWHECMPVCESGLEEALTQLHYCYTNNLTTNGWTVGADGLYHKKRSFSDGSYYNVGILPTNPPIIYSTGYVVAPMGFTSSRTNYVSRHVRVNTIAPELGGIYAQGSVTMNGANTLVDSYNSTDPNASVNGGQYSASVRQANATVLSDSGSISAHTILGTAITGPNGTVTGGPIGDLAFAGGGIQTNHVADNANVQFDTNAAPFAFSSGITPISSNYYVYQGTNYQYILGTGNYNMTSLGNNPTMLINGQPTVLYVSGSIDLTGGGIYIAPGCSLQLYVGGSLNVSGNGIVNGGGVSTNLYVYGLSSCQSMQFSGSVNSIFVGVVNAPQAAVSYAGNADFCGSLMANTVTISGNGNFHCDTGVVAKGVTVGSWNEF